MARVIDQVLGATTSSVVGEITRELVNASDGAGLHFDGSAGNIDIASPPDLGTKFSFEFVIKADSTGTSGKIVDFGDGGRFVIEHNTTGLQVKPSNAGGWVTLQSPSPLADLEVHHLVLTVDGTTATLYDNGNQVATDTISATDIDSCTDAKIGSYYDSATDLFDGTIYRCRFWNKVVDAKALFERADVDFADQYGSQTYIIDSSFASSTQSFNGAGGTTAANIDGIGGQNDTLRFTTDSATTNHQIVKGVAADKGKNVRVQGMVYIPSTNTNIKKVQINENGNADVAVIKEITTLDAWVTFDEIHVWTDYDELRFRGLKADGTSNYAGNGSDVFYIKNIKVNNAGVVSDYDLAFANPTQSLTVQDRSGAADGTASASGVTQVQPVVQGNLTSLAVSSGTARTPNDGDVVAEKLGAGVVPVAALHVKTPATTGSSPLEVSRLEVRDEGVNLVAGMGPKQSFFMPHSTASFEGASIAAKKETGTDADESTSLVFSTCPDGGTNTERLFIDSSGTVKVGSAHANEDQTSSLIISKSIASAGTYDYITLADTSNSGSEKLRLLFKGRYDTGSHPNGQEAAYISCDRAGVGDGYGLAFGTGDAADAVDRLTISRTGQTTITSSNQNVLFVNRQTSNGDVIVCEYGGVDRLRLGTEGITFPNGGTAPAAAAANQLDYYKEGSWVPTLVRGGLAITAGVDYSNQAGNYTRIGKVVYYWFDMTISILDNNTLNPSSGNFGIGGLPFTSAAATAGGYGAPNFRAMTAIASSIRNNNNSSFVQDSSTYIALKWFDASANEISIDTVTTDLTTGRLTGEGFYFTS